MHTPQTSFTIDYNKITISNIKVSNEFVFDSYDDYYHYRDADRGTKFVSAAMSVTSTEHDPHLPQLAIYRIDGGEMQLVERFMTRYANWRDYGAYLGNYRDSNNDFSKVSTVKFKVGVQVSNEILEKPYAIIIKKENGLYSSFDRYDNPPMSYNGNVNYPSSISVQDFSDDYILIKLCNLK